MLLIIYEKSDISTQLFINFLTSKKYKFFLIEASDICKVKVIDSSRKNCTWILENGIRVEFAKLKSVYLRSLNFYNHEVFKYANDKDTIYANRELKSYIIYRLYNTEHCVNKISLALISSNIFKVPYFLNIAQKNGFDVPDYLFSNDYVVIKNKFLENKSYIAHNSFFANTKFIPSKGITKSTIGLIEIEKEGEVVVAHAIDNIIYFTQIKNHQKIKTYMSEDMKEKIVKLAKTFNLISMQIIFIGEKLYNISPYPNFCLASTDQQETIFNHLTKILKIS